MVSAQQVNYDKFRDYTYTTAELFINLYGWYHMLLSVHKVLLHGADIMKATSLSIGKLSKEAQKACNKYFKRARAHNSRTFSREANNTDVMHYLLASSD